VTEVSHFRIAACAVFLACVLVAASSGATANKRIWLLQALPAARLRFVAVWFTGLR
jgi:uncharacterized membrane protein